MSVEPQNRLAELLRDPLYGVTFIRLRDRHQPVTVEPGVWRGKGRYPQRCGVYGTSWPCEVRQALEIVVWLMRL
jgi:hypothetical protein